jgi:Mg2+ and Co2+ transporter CorA
MALMSAFEHPDTNKILEYRAKAIEAAEQAAKTSDSDAKKSWDAIARSYHDMAERLERACKL